MKKVFIGVSPGFYKTNLFNELAKKEEIMVISKINITTNSMKIKD